MHRLALLAALLLAGCATAVPPVPDMAGVQAVLLGEQHDADSHRDLQERWVQTLAQRGTLRALALEMAERGTSTDGLPTTASEQAVQAALAWNLQAWPWERYRPAIMAAVRAGVPVLGANLPRDEQRLAMRDDSLDRLLPTHALQAQQQAIRLGHCELLPESQITPMTRVQIARDQAMARTIAAAVVPGKTVVLLAGAGHVRAELGVPQHLPPGVAVRPLLLPTRAGGNAGGNGRDFCEELSRQLQRPAG